jgi:hypothetical protein
MPGSLAPDRPRGAWSINHHHSRTRPRWLPPARRRPRGGRRRQPAGWPPIRACVPATVRGVPTPPRRARTSIGRRPAGQLGRPVGRCTLRACACACGARSHVVHMHLARAPMPSPAGATYASRFDPSLLFRRRRRRRTT